MRLKVPVCVLDYHRPRRHAVKWDGLAYRGHCWLCLRPIRRDDRGRWRVADAEQATIDGYPAPPN